jgi:acyl-CoA synthetase (AMP-forming)/AMP-acid ligase II
VLFPGDADMNGLISRDDAHPALVSPGRPHAEAIRYDELNELVESLARQLAATGLEPGDRLAMVFSNSPEFVVGFLAAIRCGAATAPLNPQYTKHEFADYLADIQPRAVLYLNEAVPAASAAAATHRISEWHLETDERRRLRVRESTGTSDEPLPQEDTIALLLHTSGTTGKPKQVPLRQSNLLHAARTVADSYELGPEDVSYCVMPLFHVHGLVASTLGALHTGGTVVIPPRFSASRFWTDVEDHQATWFSAVPTIHHVLAARSVPQRHTLRFARSCSSPLPMPLQHELEERLGRPVLQAYGMSEAAHQIASNPLPPKESRAGTVGFATGVDVSVVDPDWNHLGAEQGGEIVVRGPSVIDAYLDNEDANAAQFRDGWFRTGDNGSISNDGYITLRGRVKELINRGGEKISPYEVEDVVLAHPGVSEAVVFAAPDVKYGEQVAAAIVATDGSLSAEDVRAHCVEHVAEFKVPTQISIVDEIPKGPTGKVQRRLLAELLDE